MFSANLKARMGVDSTTFRENVLITAVELADESGVGNYYGIDQVVARGDFDRMRAAAALAHWLRYKRDGSSETVLKPYGESLESYAITDESRRMVDQIRRERRMAAGTNTNIGQVFGPVHTGSGNLNVERGVAPATGGGPSAAVQFRAGALAQRMQQHVEECFNLRDIPSMEAGPLLAIITPARRLEGYVRFVRRDGARFLEDPNGRDGVRVTTLQGRTVHIAIEDIVDFDDVA
jgi:hypothetical protein